MKTLGQRSVSSFLKNFITIIWYLEFLLLLTPPLVFLGDRGLRYSWPITLNTKDSNPEIKSVSNKISRFKLHEPEKLEETTREQTLSFEDSTLGRRLLQTLHNLVYIGLIMYVTWQLKKIFYSLSYNQPFSTKNASRIKWIAFSVLFLVFFDVVESILHRLYTGSAIILSGATFDNYDYSFDFRALLLGLLLLIVAEVFKRGTEYQADSESIL